MSLTLRALVPLCLITLLGGCGPGRNEFAPTCPTPKLVPVLSDITRYSGPGPAHDITDLVFRAQIVSLNGSCQAGDTPSTLSGKVKIGMSVQRGPSMVGRDIDVPVFLAVAIGEDVKDKQIFPVHVSFPPNVDHLTLVSPDIDLAIPVGGNITGASYTIIAGFQVTPQELTANQKATQQR